MEGAKTSAYSLEDLEKKYGKSVEELFSVAEYHPEAAERMDFSNYSYWKTVFHKFFHKKSVIIMGSLFILLLIFTFIAPYIGNYSLDSLHSNMRDMYLTPNSEYWFGTDNLGRDYWVQVWAATRTSIILSGGVAVGECLLGVIFGLVWGYVRALDRLFTELYNLISNIPNIIYMTLVGLFIGRSLGTLMIAMILVGWLQPARTIRNLVFLYRDREYNLASRCLGTKLGSVLVKNILPFLVSVIVLQFALSIPRTIGAETTLSYLGLGLDSESFSLGILLRNARSAVTQYPHLLIFPASLVSIVTVTFYLLGNAFSDACDPRNHV
ncbi:MAG: ABC transporter permease [Lachnospiraceae bacterium]|nr:ABC transporter permease [Lachnospiraceae bacterium]